MERRDALITGVVVAITCALISLILVDARGRAADRVVAGGSPGAVDEPDESGLPVSPDEPHADLDDPAGTDELDTFVVEAVAFVEEMRGAAFLTPPIVVALSDDDFVERLDVDLAEQFDAEPELVEVANASYRATGMIGPGDSIDEIYRDFAEAGVLGFYDPVTDELVVRQVEELSLLTKSTIVHELTHAFDDQHFDLDRPEYDDRTDEVPWTFSAVAEGSASWVETEWKATLSAAENGALLDEEFNFGDAALLMQFELSFLLYEISAYTYGEPFVAYLVDTGGPAALDDALIDPPPTSEQVMDPSRFDAAELGLQLDPPPADEEPLYEGVGGNALISALFEGNFVFQPIEWGGDQMSIWVEGDLSCLRWDIQSDTPSGLSELRAGFEEWGARVGATTVTSLDDVTIRIDRCA